MEAHSGYEGESIFRVDGRRFPLVLSAPSEHLLHQFLARLVFLQLHEFVERSGLGIVMSAPTRVRIGERHYREPDVLFVSRDNLLRRQEQFWEVANLVVEVLSPDDPDRDLIDKRHDYAVAGVGEYWIIDPRDDSIQVLSLIDGEYAAAIRSGRTEHAVSKVLPGFRMDVGQLFSKARA
jgi:Uma2 family endonuclease